MTNRAIWFCTLAVSLAVVSVSMVPPRKHAPAAIPAMTGPLTPIHSLTGISFHSVAGL